MPTRLLVFDKVEDGSEPPKSFAERPHCGIDYAMSIEEIGEIIDLKFLDHFVPRDDG